MQKNTDGIGAILKRLSAWRSGDDVNLLDFGAGPSASPGGSSRGLLMLIVLTHAALLGYLLGGLLFFAEGDRAEDAAAREPMPELRQVSVNKADREPGRLGFGEPVGPRLIPAHYSLPVPDVLPTAAEQPLQPRVASSVWPEDKGAQPPQQSEQPAAPGPHATPPVAPEPPAAAPVPVDAAPPAILPKWPGKRPAVEFAGAPEATPAGLSAEQPSAPFINPHPPERILAAPASEPRLVEPPAQPDIEVSAEATGAKELPPIQSAAFDPAAALAAPWPEDAGYEARDQASVMPQPPAGPDQTVTPPAPLAGQEAPATQPAALAEQPQSESASAEPVEQPLEAAPAAELPAQSQPAAPLAAEATAPASSPPPPAELAAAEPPAALPALELLKPEAGTPVTPQRAPTAAERLAALSPAGEPAEPMAEPQERIGDPGIIIDRFVAREEPVGIPMPERRGYLPAEVATLELSASLGPDLTALKGNSRSKLLDEYRAKVRAHLAGLKPPGGFGSDTVVVGFTLTRSGKVVSAKILESRGIYHLEQGTLNAVHAAAPFPKPPRGLKGKKFDFAIPFRFE